VAMAYTIRYGSENIIVAGLLPFSPRESFISSAVESGSTTGGGRAGIDPSEEVSMVKFSVIFGGPVRNL
jgi:hypothetical protein